ncbi:cation diffusion facilitator family transporter [Nocardioides zeae]|uniref:Cation diffusion facilitator family transporter n=1 Tax=Nocardioides zeae TaxID=1457234 RepID=A0ACC6ILT4_9ACTN|nr:cation transporter [Nocardioides zeae]MDR6175066.1 cation diffusion facilitator family transporter [Nocardioides zeae]MDR6211644.1 cation diffusion facilitator family transporter [Nocardioides zeae]
MSAARGADEAGERGYPRSRFGHTDLPEEQASALRRAVRLEIATLAFMVTAVVVVFLTMGSSQAMQTAWAEDLLALVPPLAFLIAVRRARKRPTSDHPYGFHRATGVGHLTAAVALLAVGVSLVVDSGLGLLRAEHPPIGTTELLGHAVWSGWLMIAAMVYTGIGPFVLGRLKLPLAEQLHDKVLYADADMQKADWMTALGTIVGVIGIGLGLWWADAAAALLIAGSIVHDGWRNLRAASSGLMDRRARTFDDEHPHPLTLAVDEVLARQDWVVDSRSRVRDQGHVFHVEAFVRPRPGRHVDIDDLETAVDRLRELDWKINDVVLMPVRELPETIPDPSRDQD